WVSIAPNGDAHQISLSLSADQTTSAVLVSKMASGTTTWSSPITLIRDSGDGRLNDKESITADSHDSRFVYAVWDRVEIPGTRLPCDAGTALPAAAAAASSGRVDNDRGGGRLNNFTHGEVALSRSNDRGLRWSDPNKVNQAPVPVSAFLASPAVASDGTVGV